MTDITTLMNTYRECSRNLACGLNLVWFEFSTDTKRNYLGKEPGGTETEVRSAWSLLGFINCALEQAHQSNHIHRYDLQCVCAGLHVMPPCASIGLSGNRFGPTMAERVPRYPGSSMSRRMPQRRKP